MFTDILAVNLVLFLVGLAVLIKGSDYFIESASHIAKHYKLPEVVIGLTLVSLGTSLPELATDIYASFKGEGGIAFGDIIGSNITNITMILGIGSILMGSIPVSKIMIKRDAMFLVGVFLLFLILCFPVGAGRISLGRVDGIIMLVIFAGYIIFLLSGEKHEDDKHIPVFRSMYMALVFFVLGLVMVFCGAKMMVDNVIWIAESFNMPKALIAATVVAFGTSVPELAVTIAGVLKGRNAIALGNILGSCIINLVFVLATATLINPIAVSIEMFYSVILMFVLGTILLWAMYTGSRVSRREGIVFLSLYILFWVYNIYKIF